MSPGLAKGYATATSDSGYRGLSVVDGAWAEANSHAKRDWGWRAIGETYRVSQDLIQVFCEEKQDTAIFQGCSTGGRLGHMASLRYPENYQGIISDPRHCTPDVSALLCETGQDASQCLNSDEVAVLDKWYQPAVNSAGEEQFPGGVPAGSEPFWWLWMTGKEDGTLPLNPMFGQSFGAYLAYLAYLAFDPDPGPDWKVTDFDFDKELARMSRAANYNAISPNISKFRDGGGKMIVWHGWADAVVFPGKTVQWYEQVKARAGGAEEISKNVALFIIPGMDHCGLLPGAGGIVMDSIDPLAALEGWMEPGDTPLSIAAGHQRNLREVRSLGFPHHGSACASNCNCQAWEMRLAPEVQHSKRGA
jgi:pimeloyl-ACP methyl ester carboxylesterase